MAAVPTNYTMECRAVLDAEHTKRQAEEKQGGLRTMDEDEADMDDDEDEDDALMSSQPQHLIVTCSDKDASGEAKLQRNHLCDETFERARSVSRSSRAQGLSVRRSVRPSVRP